MPGIVFVLEMAAIVVCLYALAHNRVRLAVGLLFVAIGLICWLLSF